MSMNEFVLEAEGFHEPVYFAGTVVVAGGDLLAEVVYETAAAARYATEKEARLARDALNRCCALYNFDLMRVGAVSDLRVQGR